MFPLCDNQQHTEGGKKEGKKAQSLLFSLPLIRGCMCKPVCVTTVSCDVAMTTNYAQRDRLEGGKKISLRLQRAVKVGSSGAASKYQLFEGSATVKRTFLLKRGASSHTTPVKKTTV